MSVLRSRHPEVFSRKAILKYLAKLTGKQLPRSLFFNRVIGSSPVTLLKRNFNI